MLVTSADGKAVNVANQVRRFVLDESGLETVEWAIVGGLIVAAAAGFFAVFGADASRGLTSLQAASSNLK